MRLTNFATTIAATTISTLCALPLLSQAEETEIVTATTPTATTTDPQAEAAKHVIVVANSADPDSVEIAEHYIRRRNIPAENLIAFPMPKTETITWKKFATEIHKPLLEKLVARGLVDGVLDSDKDAAGRLILKLPANFSPDNAVASSRISFLVICRGVPLRISDDKSLLPPAKTDENGNEAKRGPFETNRASVDSELAIIAIPNTPVNGAIPNPLFKAAATNPAATKLKKMVLKVARLDAPTAIEAKMLVDDAIRAEETGLMGRAYVDAGGPFPEGDKWILAAGEVAKNLGFDTTIDNARALLSGDSRYDAPALYFGWYSGNVAGFFTDENFHFPPGAIAFHLHSFSATSMRADNLWTPGLVARGATATIGNVYEPYLGLTHRFDFFMEEIAVGMCAGDAAAAANPALSWQTIFVGDPLYMPLKKPLDEQLADARERPTRLHQYAFLRAANLAAAAGGDSDKILFTATIYAPGLALNLERFRREFAKNSALPKWSLAAGNMAAENPGLLADTAKTLAECGDAEAAVKIYRLLLDENLVPATARKSVLKSAIECAKKNIIASAPLFEWERELKEKSAKAPAAPASK